MDKETATLALATDFSTPVWHSLAENINRLSTDERSLTDEQFAMVAHCAKLPVPVLPPAHPQEIARLITSMAAVLKKPHSGEHQGAIKAAIYVRIVEHLPHAALKWATAEIIRTEQWMPTPAEFLAKAEAFRAPEHRAHAKAQAIAQARRQRLFEETLQRIRFRELSHDDLQALHPHTAKVAETQGHLIIRLDGSRQYRTPEAIHAHHADLQAITDGVRGYAPPNDEREKRAPGGAGAASVGDAVASFLDGLEVFDGE